MNVVPSSETLVHTYKSTQRLNLQNRTTARYYSSHNSRKFLEERMHSQTSLLILCSTVTFLHLQTAI